MYSAYKLLYHCFNGTLIEGQKPLRLKRMQSGGGVEKWSFALNWRRQDAWLAVSSQEPVISFLCASLSSHAEWQVDAQDLSCVRIIGFSIYWMQGEMA